MPHSGSLARADGSTEKNALWVRLAGAGAAAGGSSVPLPYFGTAGTPGSNTGLFGGVGGLISHLLTGRAGGGDISAGDWTMVGENGPEILHGISGRIMSNSDSRRALGSMRGGDTYINIDAKNAELGVENRIRRGLEMSHNAAVANAVRANNEHSKRTPH